MADRFRPRSFAEAARRRHTRHGRKYDPEAARQGPWFAIGFGLGVVALLAAGTFAFLNLSEKRARDEEERMRPIRSRQTLETMRQYRMANPGDDRIEAVRAFVNERMELLTAFDQSEARQLLRAIDEQKQQAEFRKKIDRLLADVRSMASDPERAIVMRDRAAELEKLLMQLDDERAKEVKNEIFVARGKSAIEAARQMVAKADARAERGERDLAGLVEAYEKADRELAEVMVTRKFPEAQQIHDEITLKVNAIAEQWAESGGGFASVVPRNILTSREFEPAPGDSKAPWQTSPGARVRLEGALLVVEGVRPEKVDPTTERAGIAFWSPSPATAIRHYEVKFTVKIVRTGFSLLARQSTGYARHLYEFEVLPAGANAGDAFFPVEGNTYTITQRVCGKRVKIEAVPHDADEPHPTTVEATTLAREGGIGFLVKYGARIEVSDMTVKILR